MAKRTAPVKPAMKVTRETGIRTITESFLDGDGLDKALGVDEDEAFVHQAGKAVVDFLKRAAGFFTTAKALESTSLELLATAQILELPTTSQEDEEVQRFVRKTTAQKRDVEEHWKITATIAGFHKRLTSRRAKSTDALERAYKIGNDLHNEYVRVEQQRAREEQLRLEREAEERARLDRERELQQLEDLALEREGAAADLSDRERVFVEQMVQHGNGLRAAQQAAYRDPAKASTKLLLSPKIAAAIKAAQDAIALRRQQTAVSKRPLEVGPVRTVVANVSRAPGASSRNYHYGDLRDEQALITAILAGNHGIPTDLLKIDTTKLNEYAGSLFERINLWPGVRYRKETKLS